VEVKPPKDPFGVTLTMELDCKHHKKAVLKKARDKARHLARCCITGRQTLLIIETCLRPSMAYGLALMPFAYPDLTLDC
jgi:hypothetical protein